jgi:hypothetical protein
LHAIAQNRSSAFAGLAGSWVFAAGLAGSLGLAGLVDGLLVDLSHLDENPAGIHRPVGFDVLPDTYAELTGFHLLPDSYSETME